VSGCAKTYRWIGKAHQFATGKNGCMALSAVQHDGATDARRHVARITDVVQAIVDARAASTISPGRGKH
jgi:hypothetical protein